MATPRAPIAISMDLRLRHITEGIETGVGEAHATIRLSIGSRLFVWLSYAYRADRLKVDEYVRLMMRPKVGNNRELALFPTGQSERFTCHTSSSSSKTNRC